MTWEPKTAERLAYEFCKENASEWSNDSPGVRIIQAAMRYALNHTCEDVCIGHGERMTDAQFFDAAMIQVTASLCGSWDATMDIKDIEAVTETAFYAALRLVKVRNTDGP